MADARVEAAIANWAPRFLAQGVDYNDFVRVTSPLARWEEWLRAWVAAGEEHVVLAAEAEAAGRGLTAGEAYLRAALCFHFAKFVWFLDDDGHRDAHERSVKAMQDAHRFLDPEAERLSIPGDGFDMVAHLRRPQGIGRPPLVILLPGLDSTKEEFFHWEAVFLERGMATLTLEGPGQGETARVSHIRPDYEDAVTVAQEALGDRKDIDATRVGVVGVSLGGYYAARACAHVEGLQAGISIGGPFDFGACWEGLPSLTREAFQRRSGAANEAEARQRASQLNLDSSVGRIQIPFLVIFGKQDRLIPFQQAERMAAEAPGGHLVLFPEGNHVCNNMPYRYRPLAGDWMRERLADVG